ncbi:MAG: FCD domain-containing protein, partial [Planctomycetota bacterium]|nr:FCD domain-containing protein [Planctomycetota bacterium]
HAALHSIVDRSTSARKLEDWIDLDIEFHRALIEASGLLPLVAFGDLLQVFFRQFRDSVKKAEWKAGIASHQQIIDDLRDQKVERAALELTSHIESHRQRIGAKS